MEWFLVLCLLTIALCAGVCVGLIVALSVDGRGGDARNKASSHSRLLSEEELKDFRRRQREMQNFFTYTGDPLPKTEEE